jgi:hypothetical protein
MYTSLVKIVMERGRDPKLLYMMEVIGGSAFQNWAEGYPFEVLLRFRANDNRFVESGDC